MNKIQSLPLIKKKALEAGFDDCGVTLPTILYDEVDFLKKWILAHKNGNIAYLEKNIEKKADPSKIMSDVKSIIVLLHNYYPSVIQQENSYYKIAKYAYSNDYHHIIKSKAAYFIDSVKKENPDSKFKIFVDSNVLLEKIWAVRCGLGWTGKNSLFIHPKLGSFVFICVILSNLELSQNQLMKDKCGNCNLCMEACPVNAIEKPYQLNASKCIACKTIEDKNIESPAKKENNHQWIYGCDICQNVCPWNKEIPFTKEENFKPNADLLKMTKNEWENMDKPTFDKLFQYSAIKRIGFEKLKANICISA